MTVTRDDLLAAITSEVSSRPQAAMYYQAGDPRLLAQMGAMATMLSMVSEQIDVESSEVFQKTRDTTVLADATMKGILPFARPPRMTLTVNNSEAATMKVAVGRRLLDQYGRVYVAESDATIPGGQSVVLSVKQVTTRAYAHVVTNSVPFYAVPIPASDDSEQCVSGIIVNINGVLYPFTPEFANLSAGQPGFTIETNELRQLLVKFGWANTFGSQPPNGTTIDFLIEETFGETTLQVNAPFTFETTVQPEDRSATLKLASVVYPGANPVNTDTLREWSQYPSGYDSSAVYLGNFDFLVRRNLFPMRFLSIWNEQVEEAVRGPNIGNINRMFIAAVMDNVDTAWMRAEINRIIKAADDSYWLKFVDPVRVELPMTIRAQVSVVHDVGDVEAQIRAQVYTIYGEDSAASKRGMLRLNSKRTSEALRKTIPALQDDGSDFQVEIPEQENAQPEQYRYVSARSLTVLVTQSTYNDGMWSH